jgi:hypothetical protein
MGIAEELLLENLVYDAARKGNFIKLEFAWRLLAKTKRTQTSTGHRSTLSQFIANIKVQFEAKEFPDGDGCSMDDVWVANFHDGKPLIRRDYFDHLIMSATNSFVTWTPDRIRYIRHFYPNFPIPGVFPGSPCCNTVEVEQHNQVIDIARDHEHGKIFLIPPEN